MPTNNRIQSALIEVAEQLDRLGYVVEETRGPLNMEGDVVSEDEIEDAERFQYYLITRADEKVFYIFFDNNRDHAIVVYPFDVLKSLGQKLNDEEVKAILDDPVDWDDLSDDEIEILHSRAVEEVIENTPPNAFYRAAFNLSVYASSAIVDYKQTRTESGFPREFQSTRGVFPYTDHMSLSELDDRVDPVIIAGERGRRYVEHAFMIDKEEKQPQDYEFIALF